MRKPLITPVISINTDDVRYAIDDWQLDIDRDIKISKKQMEDIAERTRMELDNEYWWEEWNDALSHAIKDVFGNVSKTS